MNTPNAVLFAADGTNNLVNEGDATAVLLAVITILLLAAAAGAGVALHNKKLTDLAKKLAGMFIVILMVGVAMLPVAGRTELGKKLTCSFLTVQC